MKCNTKVPKIYRKTVIFRFQGFLGISWDILNIPNVPVSILAMKFDLKISENSKFSEKLSRNLYFLGKKGLKIFVTVAKCNGSEVYGSEVLVY